VDSTRATVEDAALGVAVPVFGAVKLGGLVKERIEGPPPSRTTPSGNLRLIPIEPVAREHAGTRFAIPAPWAHEVYFDPEFPGE
jgi:hypothetical protein